MTTTDIERIASVAAVLSHRDLPDHLQAPAKAFLNAHAERLPKAIRQHLTSRPPPDAQSWMVAEELEFLLLLIAALETVPPLAAAGDRKAVELAFGIEQNHDRRQLINDSASPVCLPFRLWLALRHREQQSGDRPPAPDGAGLPLGDRWAWIASGISLPDDFSLWIHTHFGEYFAEWSARRGHGPSEKETS